MKRLKAAISMLGGLPFFTARPAPAQRHIQRRNQRGTALVEAMAAIAITASAGVAALSLVSISAATSRDVATGATAAWVAASQAEKIQVAAFLLTPGQYEAISAPNGFIVTNETSDILGGDSAIQLVTIAVTKAGEEIVSVELVKVDR